MPDEELLKFVRRARSVKPRKLSERERAGVRIYTQSFGDLPVSSEYPGSAQAVADSLLTGIKKKPTKTTPTDYQRLLYRERIGALTKIDSIKAGLLPRAKEPETYVEKLKETAEEKYTKYGHPGLSIEEERVLKLKPEAKVPKPKFEDMQGYFNTVKKLRKGEIEKKKGKSKKENIALAEQYIEEFEKFYIEPEYKSLIREYKYFKNLSDNEAKSRASKEIKNKWGIDYIGREMLGKEAEAKLYPGTEKTVKKLIKRGIPKELAILKAKSIKEGRIPVPEFIKRDKETKWDQYEVK